MKLGWVLLIILKEKKLRTLKRKVQIMLKKIDNRIEIIPYNTTYKAVAGKCELENINKKLTI